MVLLARIGAAVALMALLTGCTDADWDHVLTFGDGPSNAQPARPVRAVVPSSSIAEQTPSYAFCQAVVADDVAHSDFDAATTKRMAEASYRQCVALFGDANPR